MSDETTHFPFDEGLPTKPDVDLLLATWSNLKVSDRIPYESVEKLLRLSRKDQRFRTVTHNWRNRLLKDYHLVVYCARDEAFYVAHVDQITSATYKVFTHVKHVAHKHRRHLAVAVIETEQQRNVVEHQSRYVLGMEYDAKKARMNLIPETKAPEQPKINPPKKSSEK